METYWNSGLERIVGLREPPHNGGILIVGGGIAGVSLAYFLLKSGFKDVQIVDTELENASYYRNAGHILLGASENYSRIVALQGREKAKKIFKLSESFCLKTKETILEENLDCDYFQGNYFNLGETEAETKELLESTDLLKEDGFPYSSLATNLNDYGFKVQDGVMGKLCSLSANANPAKFRNQLLRTSLFRGLGYFSQKVKTYKRVGDVIEVEYLSGRKSSHDALILATNAYLPEISNFVESRKLVDPFRGQIIVSKPLKERYPRFAFSMDHGYIYGTLTADNRLLIGGWRNNVEGGEVGTYSLEVNPLVENGLKNYTKEHFIFENLEWEWSWSGIMGSSKIGLPYLGPTDDPLVYILGGCTGYGFGWFHGCADLLVKIVLGEGALPEGYQLLNPNQ